MMGTTSSEIQTFTVPHQDGLTYLVAEVSKATDGFILYNLLRVTH